MNIVMGRCVLVPVDLESSLEEMIQVFNSFVRIFIVPLALPSTNMNIFGLICIDRKVHSQQTADDKNLLNLHSILSTMLG